MSVLKPLNSKQEQLVTAVRRFILQDAELEFPPFDRVFEKHMYEIGLVVETVFEEVDKEIDSVKEGAAKVGSPVTCSKGCDYCCGEPIIAFLPESMLIVQYLDLNPDVNRLFLSKYDNWRGQVNTEAYAEGVLRSIGRKLKGLDAPDEDIVQLYDGGKKVDCPFLEEHECTIYPVRPPVCRTLLSVDDPQKCRRGSESAKHVSGLDLIEITNMKAPLIYLGLLRTININQIITSSMPGAVFDYDNKRGKYLAVCAMIAGNYMDNPE